jgi:putative FmdB family regulatory protein
VFTILVDPRIVPIVRIMEALMPLYEFRCQSCQKEFEELIRNDEAARCPYCASQKVEKIFSVTARPTQSGARESTSLPLGGCGRPQCGMGGCQGLGD